MTNPIRASFIAAGIIAVAGIISPFTGSILLATLVLAAGQLWGKRDWAAWTRALLFLAAGLLTWLLPKASQPPGWLIDHPDLPLGLAVLAGILVLSRGSRRRSLAPLVCLLLVAGVYRSALDRDGVSVYSRARIIATKLGGGLVFVPWKTTLLEAVGPRTGFHITDIDKWAKVIDRQAGPNGELFLYQTSLGDFWAPATNQESVALIAKEMTALDEYELDDVRIQPGDVVIDCGGHVGFYTKLALDRGAGRVIAFEPDPENHWCFRENLKTEIADGRVLLIQAGVWNKRDTLTFYHSKDNPGAHSFLEMSSDAVQYADVPVLPLDELIAELGVEEVDWIKMDIEGAEREALAGSTEVLKRFRPNLAICTYHRVDDSEVLPPIILAANSSYQIDAKHIAANGIVRPKILFFH